MEMRMTVNGRKRKEMIIGPILKDPPPDLLLNDTVVDTPFKLFGIHVSNGLKLTEHVRKHHHACTSWSSWSEQDVQRVIFCTSIISVVRPILEYVWRTGLLVTAAQCDTLESVQNRAMRIIFIYSDDNSGDYKIRIIISVVDTLKDRREVLTERFFKRNILPSTSLLHYLYSRIGVTMTLLIVSDIHPQTADSYGFAKSSGTTRTTRFRNCFITTHTCSCKSLHFKNFFV